MPSSPEWNPVPGYWHRYLKWIEQNPQSATDVENALKWISYMASAYFRQAGRSLIISELVHKVGALASFLHDRVFERASAAFGSIRYSTAEYILGFLETSEVIFELAGSLAGGLAGKWAVVAVMQMLKTALRLLLLFKRRIMLKYPAVEPLDRKALSPASQRLGSNNNEAFATRSQSSQLKRSGRNMRSMDSGPLNLFERTWVTPDSESSSSQHNIFLPLNETQTLGEVLYVCQPLVHLAAMSKCGEQSWTPWAVSLGMDLCSHGLYGGLHQLSYPEHAELQRRRSSLLLYLVRSPFYDVATKKLILAALVFARRKIPLGKTISEVMLAYLPHLRGIYSYLWAK